MLYLNKVIEKIFLLENSEIFPQLPDFDKVAVVLKNSAVAAPTRNVAVDVRTPEVVRLLQKTLLLPKDFVGFGFVLP